MDANLPQELLTGIVDDMAQALAVRAGETQQRQSERHDTAFGMIMSFQPCDVLESILAGHCVMYHELIVASVCDTLRSAPETTDRKTRGSIVALDKAFGNNLTRLEQYRIREAKGTADAEPTDIATEMGIAERVRRHQSRNRLRNEAASVDVAPEVASDALNPLREPIPANSDDPAQEAPTVEGDQPVETWPASVPIPGLNRQARRALDRQVRRRVASAPPVPTLAQSA